MHFYWDTVQIASNSGAIFIGKQKAARYKWATLCSLVLHFTPTGIQCLLMYGLALDQNSLTPSTDERFEHSKARASTSCQEVGPRFFFDLQATCFNTLKNWSLLVVMEDLALSSLPCPDSGKLMVFRVWAFDKT